eukprot:Hpha_TRINITY_DN24451_c0_g1::TRINITY_DN24451_c0_g1_i1::g.165592::m.165592
MYNVDSILAPPQAGPLDVTPAEGEGSAAQRSTLGDRPFVLVRGWQVRRRRVPPSLNILPTPGASDPPGVGSYERRGPAYVRFSPPDGASVFWTADGSGVGAWQFQLPDATPPLDISGPVPHADRHVSGRRGNLLLDFHGQLPQSPDLIARSPPVVALSGGDLTRRRVRPSSGHVLSAQRRYSRVPERLRPAPRPQKENPVARPGHLLWDILRQHVMGLGVIRDMMDIAGHTRRRTDQDEGVYRAPPRRVVPIEKRVCAPEPQPLHGEGLSAEHAFTEMVHFHKACEEFYQTEYVRSTQPQPRATVQGVKTKPVSTSPRRFRPAELSQSPRSFSGAKADRPQSAPPRRGLSRSGNTSMDVVAVPSASDSPATRPALASRRPPSALSRGNRSSVSIRPASESSTWHPAQGLERRWAYDDQLRSAPPRKTSVEGRIQVDDERDVRQGMCDWSFLDITAPSMLHHVKPRFSTTETKARSTKLARDQARMDREGRGEKADVAAGFGAWGLVAARMRRRAKKARSSIARRKIEAGVGAGLSVIAACDERYAFDRSEEQEDLQRLYQSILKGEKGVDISLFSDSPPRKTYNASVFQRYHCRGVKLCGNELTTLSGLGAALWERCVAARHRITFLDVSGNCLTDIDPDIFSSLPFISTFYFHNNKIVRPEGLLGFRQAPNLTTVAGHGNPIEKERRREYRQLMLVLLPKLQSLDFSRLVASDVDEGRALRKVKPRWIARVFEYTATKEEGT